MKPKTLLIKALLIVFFIFLQSYICFKTTVNNSDNSNKANFIHKKLRKNKSKNQKNKDYYTSYGKYGSYGNYTSSYSYLDHDRKSYSLTKPYETYTRYTTLPQTTTYTTLPYSSSYSSYYPKTYYSSSYKYSYPSTTRTTYTTSYLDPVYHYKEYKPLQQKERIVGSSNNYYTGTNNYLDNNKKKYDEHDKKDYIKPVGQIYLNTKTTKKRRKLRK